MVHLPTHASRLNQIEIYFLIVQRKALTPNDFDELAVLAREELADLMERLAAREPRLRLAA